MIRKLSSEELEQASGGFTQEEAAGGAKPTLNARLPRSFSKGSYVPICRDERDRGRSIIQQDGIHTKWESYKPQQPSFRSRFINR